MNRRILSVLLLLLLPVCLVMSSGAAETTTGGAATTAAGTAEAVEYEALDPHTATFDKVMIAGFKEAPMLAKLVAEGKLPPVDQRVPKEPLVIKPVEEIGTYGGTLTYNRRNNTGGIVALSRGPIYENYEYFVHASTPFPFDYYPNVPKSWEFSDDGKTVTFYLREGMKWSDGAPFTSADIIFWYEDMYLDDDLFPTKWYLNVITAGEERADIRAMMI